MQAQARPLDGVVLTAQPRERPRQERACDLDEGGDGQPACGDRQVARRLERHSDPRGRRARGE